LPFFGIVFFCALARQAARAPRPRRPRALAPPLARALAAEALGTALLVFFTLATGVLSPDGGFTVARQVLLAAAAGATVSVLVFVLAPASGAVLNPAVALALALGGALPPARAAAYAAAQCGGAAAGAAAVRALSPALFARAGGGANFVQAGATVGEAFGAEAFGGLLLSLAALAPGGSPLAAGGATFLGVMLALPATRASLNPARTIGVAAAAGDWRDLWLFLAAPCAGAALAAAVHVNILTPPRRGV